MEANTFLFWNWTVVVYLFLAGVSAGAFTVSALAYLLDRDKYLDIIRTGAYIAPFPLIVGLICLIWDLERPWLFWKLVVTLRTTSVMSYGAWLLLIFSGLSFVYFYLWLPERFDILQLTRLLPARLRALGLVRLLAPHRALGRQSLNRFRGWIGVLGIPVALLVGIYTGVLLSVVSARPFWNNPMLPMLFLISALKTGSASISLANLYVSRSGGPRSQGILTNTLMMLTVDMVLVILSIITIALFIFGFYTPATSSGEAAQPIMGGAYTLLFWGLVIVAGTLFPLAIGLYETAPHFSKTTRHHAHKGWLTGAATLAVLAGGFFLRWVVVYAGQATAMISS